MDITTLQTSRAWIRLATGNIETMESCHISRSWHGERCHSTITNVGEQALHIKEIVLFAGNWNLPRTTAVYGEGFQMLSQTAGTFKKPVDVGKYTDEKHYKLSHTPGMLTAYSMVLLEPEPTHIFLLAFTSCHRFTSLLRMNADGFEVVLDSEGLPLAAQETWELEEFIFLQGSRYDLLLSELAQRLSEQHPRAAWENIPTGWCSWYIYGAKISEQIILENMHAIKAHMPQLTYIQIDDGYFRALGDWLEAGDLFPNGIKALCAAIRANGFEPAIWVAPFIAERSARLVKEHPDWFIQNDCGGPLLSNEISFGGWRNGPWYMLDGTHPQAQAYLEEVFRIMRHEWGCHYFKLDALTWGALPGGKRYDAAASRIEAYRRGMQAVRRGAGQGSFLLGCNAPMWASLGLVEGMRVTGDVTRRWDVLASIARECFWRNWQHEKLWINDPDCVLLGNRPNTSLAIEDAAGKKVNTASLTEDEILFHATAIAASGGLVLSSDAIGNLPEGRRAILRKLLPPTGYAAHFDDTTFRVGRIDLPDRTILHIFNRDDEPWSGEISIPGSHALRDYWTGEDLGIQHDTLHIEPIPPHSARSLICQGVS